MQKYCSNCNCEVDENANFCPSCGSGSFYNIDPGATTVLNTGDPYFQQQEINQTADNVQPQVNQQPVYPQQIQGTQQPQTPQFQHPIAFQTPQATKKHGLKGWHIALIVIGVLVLASMVFVAYATLHSGISNTAKSDVDDYIAFDNDDSSIDTRDDVEYTKGELSSSGVYKNEWANLKLVVPVGYSNGSSSEYEAFHNDVTECGLYCKADDDTSMFYAFFEKLPTFKTYDESLYLDDLLSNMAKGSAEVKYELNNKYTNHIVAGEIYLKVDCPFKNNYGDFVQSVYVRKKGEYIIGLSAISESVEKNDDIISRFTVVD